MRTRAWAVVTCFMATLSFSPATIHADDQIDLEAVAEKFIRILRLTESEFNCLFRIESVEHIPATSDSASKYYAEYRAAGMECKAASEALKLRGNAEGIVFFWLDTYEPPNVAEPERILDLLHQINPPIE